MMTSEPVILYERIRFNFRSAAGVLGITTGNFASEKYLDEKGVEKRGATAGLWLAVRGRPDTGAFQRVHAGRQIEYEGYRIRVQAVGSDHRGIFVRMEIEPPDHQKENPNTQGRIP
ncbi:MAG: hypothetical protein JW748_07570 [Anaerolineales bacterium]|nr:hypothetical protein [Anaerolineales bacterium]